MTNSKSMVCVFVVLLLASCGGGGGNDGISSSSPNPPPGQTNPPPGQTNPPPEPTNPQAPGALDLTVGGDTSIDLSWTMVAGATHYEVYRHTSNDVSAASVVSGNIATTSYTDAGLSATMTYHYWVKACRSDAGCSDFSARNAAVTTIVDTDKNGLIDIDSLEMLNNIRFNPAGTSYRTSADGPFSDGGCPEAGCSGYELMQDLDFDSDGDGRTWRGDFVNGYVLDTDDHNASYFPISSATAASAGWAPVGDNSRRFTGTFEGNGYVIRNLIVRGAQGRGGFFDALGTGAVIRNLGLVNVLVESDGRQNGALAGLQGPDSTVIACYASGHTNGGAINSSSVGGLLGSSFASVVASYATVAIGVGVGEEVRAGGLVGWQVSSGAITASYATGDISGGAGEQTYAGGLVGQSAGAITASYATGDVSGGGENNDNAGGLLGFQQSSGSITASYATGNVSGGAGDEDEVGALIGRSFVNRVSASYGFGAVSGGTDNSDTVGAPPGGVTGVTALETGNAGAQWNAAASGTMGAWNFGNGSQAPALNYADYDDSGARFSCSHFLAGLCGTLIAPLEQGLQAPALSIGGAPTEVPSGISLSWTAVIGAQRYEVWRHTVNDSSAAGSAVAMPLSGSYSDSSLSAGEAYYYWIKACDDSRCSGFSSVVGVVMAVADPDRDGLVDIGSLEALHNMRFDPAGSSLRFAGGASTSRGCPEETGCFGYELTQNLDFDTDNDGTWSGNAVDGYALDVSDNNAVYFPVDGAAPTSAGWTPVGSATAPFTGIFEGRGNTIDNLVIRRGLKNAGFFGVLGEGAEIRNLGLTNALVDNTGSVAESTTGALVGLQHRNSKIIASHTSGQVNGGDGDASDAGGLVGKALASVRGTNGVIISLASSIVASYSTADVSDGTGGDEDIGGLVGESRGEVTASYATGSIRSRAGRGNRAGGLVGIQGDGVITASYATGNVSLEANDGRDSAGGLMAAKRGGFVTACYATGNVSAGTLGSAGALIGFHSGVAAAVSYAFGTVTGGNSDGANPGTPPANVSAAAGLTSGNAGAQWNEAVSNTAGAWDFGSSSQAPALRYADYDDSADVFGCDVFHAGITCGTTLIPGQGR